MRFFVLASLLASTAFSQSITDLTSDVPSCAISCLLTALSDEGCSLTEIECACQNLNAIAQSAQPCLRQANCELNVSQLQSSASQYCQAEVSVTPTTAAPSSSSTSDNESETVQTNVAMAVAHEGKMLAGVVAIMAAALI